MSGCFPQKEPDLNSQYKEFKPGFSFVTKKKASQA